MSLADTPTVTPENDGTLASALRRLPLFPLPNAVLFPHALLPLHIFEERYRAMVRDILTGTRCLAIGLLLPEANEHDERPPVQPIAGVGEVVMAHELPDGRFNLVVRGRARVRIDEELPSDRPYRLVTATELPDLRIADETEITDADQTLRALIGRLADAIPEGGELLRQVVAAQRHARRAGRRRRLGAHRRLPASASGSSRPATSASGSNGWRAEVVAMTTAGSALPDRAELGGGAERALQCRRSRIFRIVP